MIARINAPRPRTKTPHRPATNTRHHARARTPVATLNPAHARSETWAWGLNPDTHGHACTMMHGAPAARSHTAHPRARQQRPAYGPPTTATACMRARKHASTTSTTSSVEPGRHKQQTPMTKPTQRKRTDDPLGPPSHTARLPVDAHMYTLRCVHSRRRHRAHACKMGPTGMDKYPLSAHAWAGLRSTRAAAPNAQLSGGASRTKKGPPSPPSSPTERPVHATRATGQHVQRRTIRAHTPCLFADHGLKEVARYDATVFGTEVGSCLVSFHFPI